LVVLNDFCYQSGLLSRQAHGAPNLRIQIRMIRICQYSMPFLQKALNSRRVGARMAHACRSGLTADGYQKITAEQG
jgi:hypothetical protein